MPALRSRLLLLFLLGLPVAFFSLACGDGTTHVLTPTPPPVVTPTPPPPPAPASKPGALLLLRSTPATNLPDGLVLLSFSATVTGAVLQPGAISLVSSPITVEINRLQIDSSLLASLPLPAGSYSSLSLVLYDPSLTVFNPSSTPSRYCAAQTVCVLNPTLATSSFTFSDAPFPVSATDTAQPALLLNFDLSQSFPNFPIVAPALTLQQFPSPGGTPFNLALKQADGTITYTGGDDVVDGALFDLATSAGTVAHIDDSTALYVDASLCGLFFCVQNEIAEADLTLSPTASPKARRVTPQVEGTVVSIDNLTQLDIVVLHQSPAAIGLPTGALLRVNLQSGTVFEIVDTTPPGTSYSVPSSNGFTFSSSSDLLVGQVVLIHATSSLSGSPLSVDTDRVRLKSASFTARVSSVSGSATVTVDHLPANFSFPQVNAQIDQQSIFEGVSSIDALKPGDTLSLSGFLFKTASNPVLIVEGLRKR